MPYNHARNYLGLYLGETLGPVSGFPRELQVTSKANYIISNLIFVSSGGVISRPQ